MSDITIHQPSEAFVKQAAVSGMAAYEALCKKADSDYEGFWAEQARRLISWKTPRIVITTTNAGDRVTVSQVRVVSSR